MNEYEKQETYKLVNYNEQWATLVTWNFWYVFNQAPSKDIQLIHMCKLKYPSETTMTCKNHATTMDSEHT